ncbi:MAG: hypothetical protein ABR520_04680, partial [Mycobacteriales bacterium]
MADVRGARLGPVGDRGVLELRWDRESKGTTQGEARLGTFSLTALSGTGAELWSRTMADLATWSIGPSTWSELNDVQFVGLRSCPGRPANDVVVALIYAAGGEGNAENATQFAFLDGATGAVALIGTPTVLPTYTYVAALPDLTSDGCPELGLIEAPDYRAATYGVLHVLDGVDGTPLWRDERLDGLVMTQLEPAG